MLDSFFTLESLMSLQGAAAASVLVPDVLGYVIGEKFDKGRKWASFIIAFGLAFLIAGVAGINLWGWAVAVCNGCLIFASAVGANQIISSRKKAEIRIASEQRRLIKSFLKDEQKKSPAKAQKTKQRFQDAIESKPKKEFFSNWF